MGAEGSSDPNYKDRNAEPAHDVTVSGFLVGKYEVTRKQYMRYCKETGRDEPTGTYVNPSRYREDWEFFRNQFRERYFDAYPPAERARRLTRDMAMRQRELGAADVVDLLPITGLTWDDAQSYAEWAELALPTEAQWERAARGDDERIYPWGNEPAKFGARYAAHSLAATDQKTPGLGPNGEPPRDSGLLWPVGTFAEGLSPYGVRDMSGNVNEWVRDTWSKYGAEPLADPVVFDPKTADHVARGGSFTAGFKDASTRHRHHSVGREPERLRRFGLRVAATVEQ
jgi:formylglycine-generating enzyme required for sulfatase activity